MADSGKASGGNWTEGEKYNLLVQVIKQLNADKAIKWDQINMPGRTPKAMTHVWAKIRSDAAAATTGAGPTGTPRARATPKKKANGSADGESPTKRKKATPKTKKAKKDEDTEESDMPDLKDESEDNGNGEEENFQDDEEEFE